MDNPQLDQHPLKRRSGFKTKAIPITLHGDGIPVAAQGTKAQKSSECYIWSSMLSQGKSSLVMNWLIWTFVEQMHSKRADTRRPFFTVLVWSLLAMWTSDWPSKTYDGKDFPKGLFSRNAGTALAGGFFAVLWGLRGDLDFFLKALKLKSAQSKNPCNCCDANKTDKSWTDFRKEIDAAWTTWEDSCWEELNPLRHIRFLMIPGFSISALMIDWMHCKHLGADQYFYGSVLCWLCRFVMRGSPKENLDALFDHIHKYSQDCGDVLCGFIQAMCGFGRSKGCARKRWLHSSHVWAWPVGLHSSPVWLHSSHVCMHGP